MFVTRDFDPVNGKGLRRGLDGKARARTGGAHDGCGIEWKLSIEQYRYVDLQKLLWTDDAGQSGARHRPGWSS